MERRKRGSRAKNVGTAERSVSVALGAVLAWSGLRRSGLARLLMLGGGGFLGVRGATGHCPVFSRFGLDTSPQARSEGFTLKRAVTVGCAQEDARSAWLDLVTGPETSDSAELSLLRQADAVIAEDELSGLISWRHENGYPRRSGSVRFTPAPGDRGTEIHVQLRTVPSKSWISAVARPLLRQSVDVKLGQELRRIKQIIETGAPSTARRRGQALTPRDPYPPVATPPVFEEVNP